MSALPLAAPHVLLPGDPGHDEELTGFQTGFSLRPHLIVAATSADDVRAAVAHAAELGLPVGVQATGHGLPGDAEGGVLISTRRMDGVRIDAERRTVRVEAGVRWGAVVAAAAPYGLAPLNGSAPGVGAVSYTLGGGLGILGPWATGRALNFVFGDGERTEGLFGPGTRERLARVKGTYDPANLFRRLF
ncbi:hypothetical protein GCM10014713_57230 [Streptomyces purpureus]|uniref:FAD-binding PCMH-type domain-containing protein n=1 Tax=Streptomyces purpureus TaxID=1951 RepID=A0A918HDF2_9ACTN|nr:hypothetical protein GCM10014713_57230 [Streptomyces purpureus]